MSQDLDVTSDDPFDPADLAKAAAELPPRKCLYETFVFVKDTVT